jgi:hypothetical protein
MPGDFKFDVFLSLSGEGRNPAVVPPSSPLSFPRKRESSCISSVSACVSSGWQPPSPRCLGRGGCFSPFRTFHTFLTFLTLLLSRRLTEGALRVWFDESQIRPGDYHPAKIEDGLENSRILVLCMSAAAFGSDWAQLESHTFRFRDPRIPASSSRSPSWPIEHRPYRGVIPLRLDDTPINKGSPPIIARGLLPSHLSCLKGL